MQKRFFRPKPETKATPSEIEPTLYDDQPSPRPSGLRQGTCPEESDLTVHGLYLEILSLTESVDTNSPGGRRMMSIIGTFAEFERDMLRERTRNGLIAARKQDRVGGRPPKFNSEQQIEIVSLVTSGKKTCADVARLFKVHPSTISRLVRSATDAP